MGKLLWGLFALGLAASCSSINVSSERMNQDAQGRLYQQKKLTGNSQNIDYLEPSAGLFLDTGDQQLPENQAERLSQSLIKQLEGYQLFQQMRPPGVMKDELQPNRPLRVAADSYFDSLLTLAVSDRDISRPLGEFFQVGNFLVYQVVAWPCPSCTNRSIMRMKLRLVDAKSGGILWTGTVERSLYDTELGDLEPISFELTDKLAQMFLDRFRVKWHKARFLQLAAH
ncbi:MAG: hypothetical protein RRB13_09510 [bacterium]|nr:hypothetical protein [bacterium]